MQNTTLESQAPNMPVPAPASAALPGLVPDTAVLDQDNSQILNQIAVLTEIKSAEEYTTVDGLVVKLNKARKSVADVVKAFFEPHKKRAKAAHQGLCDDETNYLVLRDQPLALAQEKARKAMGEYVTKMEKENARLREEARKKAEDEEKERVRLQKIEDDKAEAARKEQVRKDEEKRLELAKKAEDAGDLKAAEKILNAPPPPPPPPAPPVSMPMTSRTVAFVPAFVAPKSQSTVTVKNWTWEADNEDPQASLLALVKAAAENPAAWLQYLTFDEKALKGRAKSGEKQANVPGIRFFNDERTAAKGAR